LEIFMKILKTYFLKSLFCLLFCTGVVLVPTVYAQETHPPMDCPPPDMPGHEECMEGMKPPMGDGMYPSLQCDPENDYPQADPAPHGCADYNDCNGNGAYDLGEPCGETDGGYVDPAEGQDEGYVDPPQEMVDENSTGMRLPCPVLDESDPTCINPRGKLYLIPMPEQPKCDRQLMKKGEVKKPNRCVNICVRKMDDENQYHGAHVRRCEEKFGGEYTKQKKWCKNNKDNHKWEKHCS
jgi:hypothetical protein